MRERATGKRRPALRYALSAAAGLALVSCDDPTPAVGVLTLNATPSTALADGATPVQISAAIPADAREDKRSVSFTTSAGVFLESAKGDATAPADAQGVATVTLRAPVTPVDASVRATAAGLTREIRVTFTLAVPTSIDVEPEKFSVKAGAGEEVKVTATLRREVGRPSPGAVVSFKAITATNDSIGRFSPAVTSDTAGRVVVRFSPGPTSYQGPVTVIASTSVGQGSNLEGRTIIDVVKAP